MRNRYAWLEVFAWSALVWGAPLIESLIVSLSLCVAMRESAIPFPTESLLAISRDMLNFLGVVTAILIAVITTMYVRSSENEETGFRAFLQSLNQLRNLPIRIDEMRSEVVPQGLDILDELIGMTEDFIGRMNNIKPGWRGYSSDPELESEMFNYVNRWTALFVNLSVPLGNRGSAVSALSKIGKFQEGRIRVMVVELLTMDKGTFGKRLMKRLLGLQAL